MPDPIVVRSASFRFPKQNAGMDDPAPAPLSHEENGIRILVDQIYQRSHAVAIPAVGPSPLSGSVTNSGYVVSDLLMLGRAGCDLTALGLQHSTSPIAQEILTTLGSPEVSHLYQLSGTATAVNAIGWAVTLPQNVKAIEHADALGDKRGALKGRLTLAQNVIGIGGGVAIGGGFRITSILSNIQGVAASGFTAPTLLGRVTYGFLFGGLVLFSIFNLIFAAVVGLNIYEGEKLKRRLKECKNFDETLVLMQKKLGVLGLSDKADAYLSAAFSEKYSKKYGNNLTNKLIEEGLSSGMLGLRQILSELGIHNVDENQLKDLVIDIVGARHGYRRGEAKPALFQSALALAGYGSMWNRIAQKKEEKLTRVLGADLVQKIRNGTLKEGEIEKALSQNLRMSLILLGIVALSTLAMVSAIVFTGGIGLIIGAALMVLSSLTMLAVDHYYFNKSIESDQPARHDKKMLAVSMMFSVATIATVVALTALGVISMGVVPLAVTLAVSGIWLGYNAYTWHALNRKEHERNEKNPSFEYFCQIAKQGDIEVTRKLLGRLPVALQQMIKDQMLKDEKITYADAALRVMSEFEEASKKAREQELEDLRKALMRFLVK